jgi:hypothetical protein
MHNPNPTKRPRTYSIESNYEVSFSKNYFLYMPENYVLFLFFITKIKTVFRIIYLLISSKITFCWVLKTQFSSMQDFYIFEFYLRASYHVQTIMKL